MGDWLAFEGQVDSLVWGRFTHTLLRLPDPVAAALVAAGARRVGGETNKHPVALTRAPVVEGLFLWAGQGLLRRIGIRPGTPLQVRLRPAPADAVETPGDVALALREAERTDRWEALSAGKRRGLLCQVGTAKTAPTRESRIAALIAALDP